MLTIQNLRAYGANVDDGLQRCLNDEGFYLEMVAAVFADGNLGALEQVPDLAGCRVILRIPEPDGEPQDAEPVDEDSGSQSDGRDAEVSEEENSDEDTATDGL